MEWFFRYEAYVIALGLLALALLVLPAGADLLSGGRRRSNAAATALVILLAIPLAIRALSALAVTPGAMRNVYQQQYQMALFFRDAYPMDTIALNDIGAVSWVAPSPIVDVMGLASSQIADLKRHRQVQPRDPGRRDAPQQREGHRDVREGIRPGHPAELAARRRVADSPERRGL